MRTASDEVAADIRSSNSAVGIHRGSARGVNDVSSDYVQLQTALQAKRRSSRCLPTTTDSGRDLLVPHSSPKRTHSCKYPSSSSGLSRSRSLQLSRRRRSAGNSSSPRPASAFRADTVAVYETSKCRPATSLTVASTATSSAPLSRSSSCRKSPRSVHRRVDEVRGISPGSCSDTHQMTLDDTISAKLREIEQLQKIDCCVVRCFDSSPKGVINRGDSVKRRNIPMSMMASSAEKLPDFDAVVQTVMNTDVSSLHSDSVHSVKLDPIATSLDYMPHATIADSHTVLVMGDHGVGRTALLQQFMTSQFMAAETAFDTEFEKTVSVLLDGEETTLSFVDLPLSVQKDCIQYSEIEAYLVVFSLTDRHSFVYACDILRELRHNGRLHDAAVILVANKSDLVRCQQVSDSEGRKLAQSFGCKYIRLSAALNHRIDDLLAGLVHQIRLNPFRHSEAQSTANNRLRSTSGVTGCFSVFKHFFVELVQRKNPFSTVDCDNLWIL